MDGPKILISYSHDSDSTERALLGLSRVSARTASRRCWISTSTAPRRGVAAVDAQQLDAAAFVLVVCTETYYRRFRGFETGGTGKGVDWEAPSSRKRSTTLEAHR